MEEEPVLLPTNESALDAFVAQVTREYELPEGMDTYDMIATMILHLPTTKAFQTKSYFGHGVLKSMANQVAFKKLEEFRKIREAKEQESKELEATKATTEAQANGDTDVETIPNSGI